MCRRQRGEEGSAASFGGIAIWIETEGVDEAVKRELAAGAELVSEVAVHENGVFGKVKDPYDVVWVIESLPRKFKPKKLKHLSNGFFEAFSKHLSNGFFDLLHRGR